MHGTTVKILISELRKMNTNHGDSRMWHLVVW